MFLAGNRSHAIIPLFVFANVLPLNMLYFETACSLRKGNVLTSLTVIKLDNGSIVTDECDTCF